MTATDKKLKETIDSVQDLLELSALRTGGSLAQNLLSRVKEAYLQAKRPVAYDVLEGQVTRTLLEQRRYQKRTLFGSTWIRALLRPIGAASSADILPSYVPDALATELPLFQRFPAKVIASLEPREDEAESAETCVRVLALARVLP